MTHQGAVPRVEFRQLARSACKKGFTCGAREVDDYLRKQAWDAHKRGSHRVTSVHLGGNDAPVAFYSLACVTEQIGKLGGAYHLFGGADHFPCLQLVWLGVHTQFQGKQIGKRLVGRVIETFAAVGEQIGLPHLVLVPISDDVKEFYRALGFVEYDGGTKMFLPLQTAIDATSA